LNALRRDARKRAAVSSSSLEGATGGPPVATKIGEMQKLDRNVLELVFLDPSIIARLRPSIEPEGMTSDAARRIYAACCRLVEDGWQNDFGRLMAEFDSVEMKNLLVQLDESAQTKASADREQWLQDVLDAHRRRAEEIAHRKLLAAARQDSDNAEQMLAQFCEQRKSKHLSEYERRKK
jgi:hypothetical protein